MDSLFIDLLSQTFLIAGYANSYLGILFADKKNVYKYNARQEEGASKYVDGTQIVELRLRNYNSHSILSKV